MAGAIDLLRTDESRAASSALKKAQEGLGQDAFLKLLLTELQHQDAIEPVKDKDFIAQLAQFSSLEEMETLATAFDKFVAQSGTMQMLGVLGRYVKGVDGEGEVTGRAVGIKFVDGSPVVSVETEDGSRRELTLAEISEVEVFAPRN